MDTSFEEKVSTVEERVRAASDYTGFTNMMFIRFLRGQKMDVDNAVKSLIATGEFRKENNSDNISIKDCEVYYNRRVTRCHGFDKSGRPVIYCVSGRHSRTDRDINDVKNFIIYIIEESLKKAKPNEQKIAIVFDLSTFSMNCMDFEATKILVTILQTHYPEILGKGLIVDAPFIFRACWQIIRPWLDPVTASKIEFIRSNQINEYISSEEIWEDFRVLYKMPTVQVTDGGEKSVDETIPFTNEDAREVETTLDLPKDS